MEETRTLIFDIETSPMKAWTWQYYDANVLQVIEDSFLLSFAYKWHGKDDEVTVVAQPDFTRAYRRNRRDDRQLAEALFEVLDQADIVVAHNGDKFDIPKAVTRFAHHRMGKPSPFQSVDTLKIVRKEFKLPANKLDEVARFFDLGGKLPTTGKSLWFRCMEGDLDAWETMKHYNVHDVVLLEEVYELLLPYTTKTPNLALLSDQPDACPRCGKNVGFTKRGFHNTGVNRYQTYQCKGCSGYSRGRTAIKLDEPVHRV